MPLTQEESDTFHRFDSKRLENGFANLSLEEALEHFRVHQDEFASIHAALDESDEDVRRGDVGLNPKQLMAEFRAELAKEGITA